MPDEESTATFSHGDYDAIEAAVMETARGRWFLREFARRNRNADTETVLAAITGLEKKMVDEKTARTMDQIRSSLEDMMGAILETKADIVVPPGQVPAPISVDADAAPEESARRIARIIETLHYLERRIHAMMTLCEPDGEDEAVTAPMAGLAEAPVASAFIN